MPYIEKEDRIKYLAPILELKTHIKAHSREDLSGQLNFIITTLINEAYSDAPLKYKDLNAIVGMLECCKQEYYRRVVSPYEDSKIKENGDL